MSGIHIFYGFAKRRCPERPRCMYCDKRRTWVAFTYFGAPVCGECWDGKWRLTEDGECDPPFDAITNEQTGEWLRAGTQESAPSEWCFKCRRVLGMFDTCGDEACPQMPSPGSLGAQESSQ